MSKAQQLLRRLNSSGIEPVLRADNANGRFIDYVDINTRESVAFRFEYPDGRVEVIKPRRAKG